MTIYIIVSNSYQYCVYANVIQMLSLQKVIKLINALTCGVSVSIHFLATLCSYIFAAYCTGIPVKYCSTTTVHLVYWRPTCQQYKNAGKQRVLLTSQFSCILMQGTVDSTD